MSRLFDFFRGDATTSILEITIKVGGEIFEAMGFNTEQIETIMGTMHLAQGVFMLFIALVAIYILYKVISHFF